MGRKTTVWILQVTIKRNLTRANLDTVREEKPEEGNHKRETKFLQIAAQKHPIRTNYIKARINNLQQNSKFRLCSDRDETISHIKANAANQ